MSVSNQGASKRADIRLQRGEDDTVGGLGDNPIAMLGGELKSSCFSIAYSSHF